MNIISKNDVMLEMLNASLRLLSLFKKKTKQSTVLHWHGVNKNAVNRKQADALEFI